ncbi:GH3 auxin-responsive promoter [Selenomonas ruminantium]|uniref:GH3 auxin-responsive promoter n=1 Tax=Selenomonas ruminantium TaxID=971 RepID=A0A1M6SE98_SELRU|nr:GH3 auxin-responsive promoter family protein [Selenomonas ruminantium]SHK43016.1 GH3 auxin-responsive promoter [Selenomonas ruminantium]
MISWNLCLDIEQGKINFSLDVPAEFQASLQSLLTPEPERARELRAIFGQGFAKPVAALVWPKLKRIVAIGTGSFAVYTKALSKYIGDLPQDNGLFATSEALIGKSMTGSDNYKLLTGENFYEFRPLTATPEQRPLFISELQAGESYEIILTNRAGLYRYATEMVIKVESCEDGKLIFSDIGQLSDTLTLEDGLLWEQEIYQAIAAAAEADGVALLDYSYCLQDTDGSSRLQLMLETDDKTKNLAPDIDKRLCEANQVYAAARKKGLLPCEVSYLAAESHLLYRDVQRFRQKTAPDQIKPTHFLNTTEKIKFFTAVLE